MSSATSDQGSWVSATLASAGIASMAGTFSGLLWGGVGGRIAMRVLFLTSGDRVKGLISDDGFEIGTISAATIFLLIFTAILGGSAGFFYGLLRMVTWGPSWSVASAVGVAAAAGAGALIVNTHGVDFRFLEPVGLAVALFVFIPGAWGVTIVLLTRRLMRPGTLFPTLPDRINERRWGAVGWLVLCAITVLSVIDLASDIGQLS